MGIHHTTFSNCLITGELYLNKYIFKNEPINKAINLNLTVFEVKTLLDNDRLEFKLLNTKSNQIIIKDSENNSKIFSSVKDCLEFLNTIGSSNKTTLLRKITKKIPYHGYICEWYGEKVSSLKDKAIEVKVIDTISNEEIIFNSLRQAAIYLSTTGQTIKLYADKGNIFKDKYKIYIR